MRWMPFVMLGLVCAGGCVDTKEARLAEARALQDAGSFGGSIETLREILVGEPNHAEANYRLGVALAQTGRTSQAVWPLSKAEASDDYGIPAGLLMASLLLEGQAFEEAVRAAERVLARQPDEPTALLIRGQARSGLGSHEEALEDAERLLAVEPEHLPGWLLRANSLIGLERLDEAEAALLFIRERAEALGEPSQAAGGCVALADFYQRQKDGRAATSFRTCFEAYPGDLLVVRAASDFFDASGDPDTATSLWREALKQQPDILALHLGYAARLQRHDRLEEAGAALEEAAEDFNSVEVWSRLASFHQQRGEFEQAGQAIERALERHGFENPELRFHQADVLVSQGEFERAEALAAALDEPVYRDLIRGRVLLARGRYTEAYDALDAGIQRWPNNASARFLAGQAAEADGRLERAIEHYREAVRADAKATDAALAAARLLLADGRFADAAGFALLHRAERPSPGPESYQIAARASSALGDFAAARRDVVALAGLPDQEGAALIERAAVERRASGPAAAARVVEEAGLDLTNPAHDEALRSLVRDRIAEGRHDDALALANQACEANPNTPGGRELRARVLARAGRLDEAVEEFETALALDANFVPALDGLGRIKGDAGAFDEAVALLDRAAAGAGRNDGHSGYRAAQLRLAQGRTEEALARLREVVRVAPGHPGSSNDLAWLLAERGEDLEFAQQLAERAVRHAPSAEFYDTLGWVQLKRGQTEAAIAALESSLAAAPSAPSVRYRLGLALAAAGREEEALAVLRKAVGGAPFPELEAARTELTRLEEAG